ncbi:MAG: GNAT family N-acetyltransferase [Erysipelotrichaceae bacterium]
MKKYFMDTPTAKEAEFIDAQVMQALHAALPFTQADAFIPVQTCFRDENDAMVGGILAYSVMWKVLYIDSMWVRTNKRLQGIGSGLLQTIEHEAKANGCSIAHLDLMDVQAIAFFEKNGYQEVGRIEGIAGTHAKVFLSKVL